MPKLVRSPGRRDSWMPELRRTGRGYFARIRCAPSPFPRTSRRRAETAARRAREPDERGGGTPPGTGLPASRHRHAPRAARSLSTCPISTSRTARSRSGARRTTGPCTVDAAGKKLMGLVDARAEGAVFLAGHHRASIRHAQRRLTGWFVTADIAEVSAWSEAQLRVEPAGADRLRAWGRPRCPTLRS
jgi:hypothetical protein